MSEPTLQETNSRLWAAVLVRVEDGDAIEVAIDNVVDAFADGIKQGMRETYDEYAGK